MREARENPRAAAAKAAAAAAAQHLHAPKAEAGKSQTECMCILNVSNFMLLQSASKSELYCGRGFCICWPCN